MYKSYRVAYTDCTLVAARSASFDSIRQSARTDPPPRTKTATVSLPVVVELAYTAPSPIQMRHCMLRDSESGMLQPVSKCGLRRTQAPLCGQISTRKHCAQDRAAALSSGSLCEPSYQDYDLNVLSSGYPTIILKTYVRASHTTAYQLHTAPLGSIPASLFVPSVGKAQSFCRVMQRSAF